MNSKQTHEILEYIDYNNALAICRVHVENDIAVVKEIAENCGMSVTNSIELIARRISIEYGISAENLKLYELYQINGVRYLSKIKFLGKHFSVPIWSSINIEEFEQSCFSLDMLGCSDSF